jgi:hypothetical protein
MVVTVLASCTTRPEISELLTINNMAIGVDDPTKYRGAIDFGDDAKACICKGACKIRVRTTGATNFFALVPGLANTGRCVLTAYTVTESAAQGSPDFNRRGAAFELFKMKPAEIRSRFGDQYLLKRREDRGVAYCVPFTGQYDGLDRWGKPVHVTSYRMAFSRGRLEFLLVELLEACPEDPFPDVP